MIHCGAANRPAPAISRKKKIPSYKTSIFHHDSRHPLGGADTFAGSASAKTLYRDPTPTHKQDALLTLVKGKKTHVSYENKTAKVEQPELDFKKVTAGGVRCSKCFFFETHFGFFRVPVLKGQCLNNGNFAAPNSGS